MGSGGNASPTGFICVCGPGLVDKPLLHRVDISRAPLVLSGCHVREWYTPRWGQHGYLRKGADRLESSGYT